MGLTIIETKYEKLSSYSFPTPEEILGREKKVDEAWVSLDQLAKEKKEILDDDLAREVFKAKVCLDNEQHQAKFKNLEKWIGEKESYLKAKDECLSVSQAQENLQTFHAYKQENVETANGDV